MKIRNHKVAVYLRGLICAPVIAAALFHGGDAQAASKRARDRSTDIELAQLQSSRYGPYATIRRANEIANYFRNLGLLFAHGGVPAQVVEGMAAAHNAHGGSTTNAVDGDLVRTNSYSVSVFPDLTTRIPGKNVTAEQISEFAVKLQAAGIDTRSPNISIGKWYDEESGITFLDAVFTTRDRDLAIQLGRQFNQKAIYDLGELEEIATGGTGETLAGLPAVEERLGILLPPGNSSPSYAQQARPSTRGAPAQAKQSVGGRPEEVRQDLGGPQEEDLGSVQ